MGFYKKNLRIKVLYGGKWYYASSITIDRDGSIDIDYCHGVDGAIDSDHVEKIEIVASIDSEVGNE